MILRPYDNETARLLANPPTPGQNRHEWLFRVQARLIRAGVAPAAVTAHMEAFCSAAGWGDRAKEVSANTEKIVATAGNPPPAPEARTPRWPEACEEERRRRYATPPMFSGQPLVVEPGAVLRGLYRGDVETWVCAAKSVFSASTWRLADLLPVAGQFEFIVANPMRAEMGATALGKPSGRSKSNACTERDRRYLVVEFDTGDMLRDQIAVLSSLHASAAPLALAVCSGGKSIHGWFNVSGLSPYRRRVWFALAAYLGADVSLWDTSKLVRMPGGHRRGSGATHDILYWEPEHAV